MVLNRFHLLIVTGIKDPFLSLHHDLPSSPTCPSKTQACRSELTNWQQLFQGGAEVARRRLGVGTYQRLQHQAPPHGILRQEY